MNNEHRPSWLPSGSHCIIPSAFVDEMQETLHVFITAQQTGDAESNNGRGEKDVADGDEHHEGEEKNRFKRAHETTSGCAKS